jgi:hypothetical protein
MPIKIEGMEALLKQLDEIEQLKPLKSVLKSAGMYLVGKLKIYPAEKQQTRTSVYGEPFKTEKQRRYFFYALKKGLITVPYSRGADARSERFKAAWTMTTRNSGMTVVIGNDTTYGPYLMDDNQQSKFMAAKGWKTIGAVEEEEAKAVSDYVIFETSRLLGLQS